MIIVDPRAGHGPGIGGFKRDAEVGMALHEGHPTYSVIFFPLHCSRRYMPARGSKLQDGSLHPRHS